MTYFFYMVLRPSPLDVALLRYDPLSVKRVNQLAEMPKRFFDEVSLIYSASLRGNPEAIKVLIYLQIYAKGKARDDVPGVKDIFEKYPKICKKIVLADDELVKIFGELFDSQG